MCSSTVRDYHSPPPKNNDPILKRTIVLFWKGLTGIIAATAEWFTVILGMKDESKYGKFIRRVVGGETEPLYDKAHIVMITTTKGASNYSATTGGYTKVATITYDRVKHSASIKVWAAVP